MNILALDTSTSHCSVALWADGIVAERDAHAGQRHSEILLAMVDAVLVERGIAVRSLDGIAFGRGPGSFTGLRIACGVAQGLAFAAGRPVAGIDTLLALAAGAGAQRVVCCVDARMGEVYHGAYTLDGGSWTTVLEPSVCAPQSVPELEGGEWLACGNGFDVHAATILPRYAGQLAGVRAGAVPHARDVARLAEREFARGGGVAAEFAAPFYVRDKVALKTAER